MRHSLRLYFRSVTLFMALGVLSSSAAAQDIFLEPGKPTRGGTDTFAVFSAGQAAPVIVNVKLDGTETPGGKANAIAAAMALRGIRVTVTNNGLVRVRGQNAVAWSSKTGEGSGIRSNNAYGLNATLEYEGDLSGQNPLNQPANYSASLGFDGVFADSNVNAAQLLPNLQVADLLNIVYNDLLADLPPEFQPLLTLDLPNQAILFDHPPEAFNPFVGVQTDDVLLDTFIDLRSFSIPEPSAVTLAALGLLLLGLAGWRTQRRV